MKRLLFLGPALLFAVLAVFLYAGLYRGSPARLPSPLVGKPAPDVALPALDGHSPFTRADLAAGKPVIVNFWASWCGPCRIEHPLLERLAAREGVQLFGIVYKDDPVKANAFLTELGNPFARINEDRNGRAGIEWGVTGVPETFVIGGDGVIRARYNDGPLTEDVLRRIILPALAP